MIVAASAVTDRPIIGIFAHPINSSLCPNEVSCQYIAASYVKFVESHGARAVPISYYATNETIDELFASVNGVLFPGGSAELPPGAVRMYEVAMAANERGGDHFPIWGTCLGFEWLVTLAGGTVVGGFAAENVTLPLVMNPAAAPTSALFGDLGQGLYDMLQGDNTSAFNNHEKGVTPSAFALSPRLSATFTALSTSVDLNGAAFVSSMEGRRGLPLYGVQWHVEKNAFETASATGGGVGAGWAYEAIPHGAAAVDVTMALAKVLVDASRRTDPGRHGFADPAAEAQALIWRYPVFYTAPEFAQMYIADF